jgi:hypothetical protein
VHQGRANPLEAEAVEARLRAGATAFVVVCPGPFGDILSGSGKIALETGGLEGEIFPLSAEKHAFSTANPCFSVETRFYSPNSPTISVKILLSPTEKPPFPVGKRYSPAGKFPLYRARCLFTGASSLFTTEKLRFSVSCRLFSLKIPLLSEFGNSAFLFFRMEI